MHLQKRRNYIARIGVLYQLISYFCIIFMAFFLQHALYILVQLIFFLFDDSLDIRDLSFLDIYLVHFFDVQHLAVFFRCDKSYRCSFLSGSSGPSYSMGISFCVLRYRVIDDVRHVVDVDSSGCDIRGYEDIHFFVFEALEKMFSLFLREIAVKAFCAISFVVES